MATKKTVKEEVLEEVQVTPAEELPEEVIYPGGPTMGQIDAWKEAYGQVFMTEVDDDDAFIWRVLTRKEFKEIMKLENNDPMYKEEKVCEACILWPAGYTFSAMAGGKAGTPTILAEQVMEKSGFTPKTGPIAL